MAEHLELGFAVQAVRDVLKSGDELVKVYTLFGSMTAVKAPLTKRLKAGTEYEFEIKSTDYAKLSLANNQNPSAFLKQEGDVYRISIRPEKGTLRLSGRAEALDRNIFVLSYVVE